MAGSSARERADASLRAAEAFERKAEHARRSAGAWARGADGEVAVAGLLADLTADGFLYLSDRRDPGSPKGNIDHLVVGPPGVIVIDAKNWTGTLTIDGRSLRQNGRRRDSQVRRVRTQAGAVTDAIDGAMAGSLVPVRPVMCFVGEARLDTQTVLGNVHLVNAADLVPFVRSREPLLDHGQVLATFRRLLDVLPPRTDPTTVRLPVEKPAGLVVFLEPWRKGGHHRLYVKTSSGEEAGHLDLSTGAVHAATESWEPVLAQVLPHYLRGAFGADLEQTELTADARGAIRRFLDSVLGRPRPVNQEPIIAGYHWVGRGQDRLYVDRLSATGKTPLGWVDLVHARYRCEAPGVAGVLGYCVERYRDISRRRGGSRGSGGGS